MSPGSNEKSGEGEERKQDLESLAEDSQLFGALDGEARRKLLESGVTESFAKGDVILSEGEDGTCFYLLRSGRVEVTTKAGEEPLVLAKLGAGAVFGEVPAFSKKARTATVTAVSDVEAIRFENATLETLLEENPLVREELEELVMGRARDTIEKLLSR